MDTTDTVRALVLDVRDKLKDEVDDVEVWAERFDRTSYSIEGDQIIPALEYDAWRVAVRALKGGALATSATTLADADAVVNAARRSLAAAQPATLADFAITARVERDTRNADEAVSARVDRPGEVRRLASALVDEARAAHEGDALVIEGEVGVERGARALVTKRGEPVVAQVTGVGAFVMIDGNDWDAWSSTHAPADAVITGIGRALVASLPSREVSCGEFFGGSREVTAVLHPRLVEGLLRGLLLERVALDRVLAGLSNAKVGETLAHPSFTLVDDTGAARSRRGAPTDDEGTPGQRKVVIGEGTLRALVSDRRTAALGGHGASTGNGYRIPILAEDRAEAPVRVGFGHLEVAPGDVSRDALVKGRTVLITDLLGMHSANKATGAFNNPIQGGLALEDGVPVARLRPGAWSATGNFYHVLRALTGLSRERLDTGGALVPWVAGPVQVA